MKYMYKMCVLAVFAALSAVSCDSYKDTDNPGKIVEADKNLAGVWQLAGVTRNGVEITDQMNCGQFKLHLEKSGRYTLENRLPFPVAHDGFWEVDDPAHPFQLTFTEDDVIGDPESVEILYPIVDGKRRLTISHSPGCDANNYIYVFVQSN